MRLELNRQGAARTSHKPLSLGVVIPCHNNSWQLNGILHSLKYQSVRPETVVVVDDNSNTWQGRTLRMLCREHGARYRKLPAPRHQLEAFGRRSHARNVGTKCLDTDIVLYLDGDMLLGPGYIEEIKYYHSVLPLAYMRGQRFSISAAQQSKGMELCLAEVRRQNIRGEILPLDYVMRPTDFIGKTACEAAYYDKWEWCASNNLSVRNEHAAQIGYWDENFLGWGEEDMDFSFRLHRLGLTPIYLVSQNTASYHLDHPVDRESNRLTLENNGKYLLSKFPEVTEYRRDAYARYDVNVDDLSPKSIRSCEKPLQAGPVTNAIAQKKQPCIDWCRYISKRLQPK